jgi:carbonic anhydrase
VEETFADLFAGNEHYASMPHEVAPTGVARRGLAILTCIDSRIAPLAVFGLEPGDAKILRNAGGRVTDDALRSLALAVAALGVTRIAVVQHTGCRMTQSTDAELRAVVAEATGHVVDDLEPLAIGDAAATLDADVAAVLASPWVPDHVIVGGLMYDLESGRLTTVVEPRCS